MRVKIPVLLFLLAAALPAQLAVSVRAGLIQHIQGRAYVEDRPVQTRSLHFQHLEQGKCLRTERGRAEIVLAPGRVLRLDRQSAFEIISDDITDVKIALLRGSAFIDWNERFTDGTITVQAGDASVRITERGLYRISREESALPELRVYTGKAVVLAGENERTVKSGRMFDLASAEASSQKFDRGQLDYFDRWNNRRSLIVDRMTAPPGAKRVRRRLGPRLGADRSDPDLGGFGGFGPRR